LAKDELAEVSQGNSRRDNRWYYLSDVETPPTNTQLGMCFTTPMSLIMDYEH